MFNLILQFVKPSLLEPHMFLHPLLGATWRHSENTDATSRKVKFGITVSMFPKRSTSRTWVNLSFVVIDTVQNEPKSFLPFPFNSGTRL